MRRARLPWTYLVITALCILYGGSLVIRKAGDANKDFFFAGLGILIAGVVMLVLYLVFYFLTQRKKQAQQEQQPIPEEEERFVEKEEPKPARPALTRSEDRNDEVESEERPAPVRTYTPRAERQSYSAYDNTFFVRQVGFGPVLVVAGNRIRDMRTNNYYRLEGNHLKLEGSGPVYEISGNRIRSAFGGYLYEVSGNSINKVYGGYYASLSGPYLTKVDLSEKYELGDRPDTKMLLAIVALLFGEY